MSSTTIKPMRKLRCLVMLSGRGSNLATMLAATNSRLPQLEICAVVSNRCQARGLEIAKNAGIPALCLPPAEYSDRDSYDAALIREIEHWNADIIVLAGFMRILGSVLVNRFKGKIINLHPSLLPKYTGLDTYNRALSAGDSEYGASIHFVTPILDAGALIAQVRLPIESTDTAEKMATRLQPIEHQLLLASLELFSLHTVNLIDDKLNIDGITYEQALPLATDGHLHPADH